MFHKEVLVCVSMSDDNDILYVLGYSNTFNSSQGDHTVLVVWFKFLNVVDHTVHLFMFLFL